MPLLETVSRYLQQRTVPHALIGAAALAVHGVSRSTFDQDLLVTDGRVLDETFWRELSARVELRRGDPDDPLAGVARIRQPGERDVDIVIGRRCWQQDLIARAEPLQPAGSPPVALAADLVLLKLYAGGSQDRWDIEQLLGDRCRRRCRAGR